MINSRALQNAPFFHQCGNGGGGGGAGLDFSFELFKIVGITNVFGFVYTVISTNVVSSRHEAKRQDRKFTWDFYE